MDSVIKIIFEGVTKNSINISNKNENNIQIIYILKYEHMFKVVYQEILKCNLNIQSEKLSALLK